MISCVSRTLRGCHGSQSHTSSNCATQNRDPQNRSLKQRNLRGGPTTFKREPIASARREQAHGPTFPKAECEGEDVADYIDELLQRESEDRFGCGGRRRTRRKRRKDWYFGKRIEIRSAKEEEGEETTTTNGEEGGWW